jgi:hypothetical protein
MTGPAQGATPDDSLRAVLDSVFADPNYRWTHRPHPLAFLGRWWDALQRWLSGLQQNQPAVYWLIFGALVVVLVAILVHAIFVMSQTLRAAGAPVQSRTDTTPPEIRGAAWYRREALRLARAGQYPAAMQADFLGLVLELDQRRVLRFHPSKTPNEYSHEPSLSEAARPAFRDLVRSLYGYAFAREPCGRPEFDAWRERAVAERYAPAH